jgi:hypothetical protein
MKPRFRRALSRVTAAPQAALASVPAVGDTRSFRVMRATTLVGASGGCAGFVEITARVVYVGSKSVVYEDVTAPLAGQMDSHFARLGQEFDASVYGTINTYFADPLITDSRTDGDGRLNMVFTPSIPPGWGAFVVGCDFFQRNDSDNRASNFGEYFYARVPTSLSSGLTGDTRETWLRQMRSTIVHEVKHIASFGAHLVNTASTVFEHSWLEEGTARIAEEIWVRDWVYSGALWKGNLDYAETLFCEAQPDDAGCGGAPRVMFSHYQSLYRFLDVPGATSVFGRVSDDDFTFYGSSWSFVRYNIDRYGASEAGYLRGLTNSSVAGIENVVFNSGAHADQILGMWSLALYLDERPSMTGNIDVRFPSWNTTGIFEGMNRDFQPQGFVKPYPLVPEPVPGADFIIEHAGIRGGSFSPHTLFPVSVDSRTISLTAAGSAHPAPTALRLVIARTQ